MLSGGAKANTDHGGYSGKGFVDGLHQNAKGTVTFAIDAPAAGRQALTLRYSAGFSDSEVRVVVNGREQQIKLHTSNGSWEAWTYTYI